MKGVYEFTELGMVGVVNYDRLKTAKWHQKILAKLSKRYKRRFRDYTPIEVEHKGGGNYDIQLPKQKEGSKVSIEFK